MTVQVETLVEVALREVWSDEASLFTPWLAENPGHLSQALGMQLELVGREVPVGPFSADIVLVDPNSGRRVVVENLLRATDHDHLGKLITYASGLEAACAVLVAERFRPEHRSALMWLNSISTPETAFFGIEVHAVKIRDSRPAVRFEVVVEPDDWQRQVRESVDLPLSATQLRYVDWWTEFLPALQTTYPRWTSTSKPPAVNWLNLPAGRRGVRYAVSFSQASGIDYRLRVELYMEDGATWWPYFNQHRDEIDAALGPDLSWEPLQDGKASRIAKYLGEVDPDDREAWPSYRRWALQMLGEFRTALQPLIDARP